VSVGSFVHQRVTGEERGLSQAREDVDPGPPAWNELPRRVRVAPPLHAYVEVEERAGPSPR